MSEKINWPITLIIIFSLGVWSSYTFGNWRNVPASDTKTEIVQEKNQAENSQKPTANSNHSLTYSGWIPSWASVGGYTTVVQHKNLFGDISPVWYEATETGELKDTRPANSNELIKLAQQNNIKIIPSIALFDHEIFTLILQNETNFNLHIDSIEKIVLDNQFDGIDLDYESTKLSDKAKYFEFLEKLSTKLHQNNKILSVTVLAKWGDDIKYSYLPQTREVQDWTKIAKFADEIRIMTYDYTSASALNPGPIAPLDWINQVVEYALTKADASKFVLGIHLYSYEKWVEVPDINQDLGFGDSRLKFIPDFKNNSLTSSIPARSYDYSTVQKILQNYQGQTEDYQGEKIFRYSKINQETSLYENRVLVYIDSGGIEQRLELARQNGLKGIVFWQLGNGAELLSSVK